MNNEHRFMKSMDGIMASQIEQGVDGVLFVGEASPLFEERILDNISSCIQARGKNCLFFIAVDGLSDNACQILQFECNAKAVTVKGPDPAYYEKLFLRDLENSGWALAKRENVREIIWRIRNYRCDRFRVEDFPIAIEKAGKNAKKHGNYSLKPEHFCLEGMRMRDPEEELNEMIGLENAKKMLLRLSAISIFEVERKGMHAAQRGHNAVFAGPSGSGKTSAGEIYSRMLFKYGIANGKFFHVCKSDYVGAYVGHTAAKMEELFQKARGGVIFFDEAGALLTRDSFTEEAMTELIRFMELYRDVVCIFATYEDQAEKLMEKDQGFRSRVGNVIRFQDYSNEDLYRILALFHGKEELEMPECRDILFPFLDGERRKNPYNFGNGRILQRWSHAGAVLPGYDAAVHRGKGKAVGYR